MGLFDALAEGRYAAKVIKHMGHMLNVSPRKIPLWMKESTKEQAKQHMQLGLSPIEVAQMKVERSGKQVLEDIKNGEDFWEI